MWSDTDPVRGRRGYDVVEVAVLMRDYNLITGPGGRRERRMTAIITVGRRTEATHAG